MSQLFKILYSFPLKVLGLIKNVRRTLEWVPVIWNDSPWDYAGLFTLVMFKTKELSTTITQNSLLQDESIERIQKSIRVFNLLLSRYSDEMWYHTLSNERLMKKWGPRPWMWSSEHWDDKGAVVGTNLIIAPRKAIVEGRYQEFAQDSKKAYKAVGRKRDADLRKAFKIFRKYHQTWWD